MLFIERLDGMDIDDINADAFFFQCIGSLNGFHCAHETGRNNGDVRALAQRDALAKLELVIIVVVDAFHSQTAEADIARALVLNSGVSRGLHFVMIAGVQNDYAGMVRMSAMSSQH